MAKKNKRNVLFFKGKTMRELYDRLDKWQKKNNKRFLSVSIQKDGEAFCCIALTNPSEVVITNLDGDRHASVFRESGTRDGEEVFGLRTI